MRSDKYYFVINFFHRRLQTKNTAHKKSVILFWKWRWEYSSPAVASMTLYGRYIGESGREKKQMCATVVEREGGQRERKSSASRRISSSGGRASSSTWSPVSSTANPLCASLVEISPPAEVSRTLRQPSLPTTYFSSGARLFLAQLQERLSFRSFSYLSQFLEYLMENGDQRPVVLYFLPLHTSNCTYHMRLLAGVRDPSLSPALHVSTLRSLGHNPGCEAWNGDRWSQ